MTQVTGKVVNIYAEDTGSTLAAEAVLGATEIVVDDAFDFEETGGNLTIDGDPYVYLSANQDDETITLAAPLPVPYGEDEPVLIDPHSSVIYAQIDLADSDEGLIAVIPSSIALTLTEGIREHFAEETVVVDDSTGTWQVQGIYAELPFIPANNVDVEAILVDVNAALETLNTVVLPALEVSIYELNLDLDELELTMAGVETDIDGINDTLWDVNSYLLDLESRFPVTTGNIAANAVTTTNIADDAITTPKLVTNAVTADEIAANSIIAAKIAADAVIADKIAANAVIADKIAANAVTTAKLDALAVTADKIAANAVTADKIIAGAITTDKMTANTINGDRIQTNTLSASKIVANSITSDKIGANQIVAAAIAATAIDGKTITGAVIQTAASGERVIIRNDGSGGIIEAYSGVTGVAWEAPAIFNPGLPTIGTQPTLLIACGTSSASPGEPSIRFYAGAVAAPSGGGTMLIQSNVTYIGGGTTPQTYISGNVQVSGQITTAGAGISVNSGAILLTTGGHVSAGGNFSAAGSSHMQGNATVDGTLQANGVIFYPNHPTTTAAVNCHLNGPNQIFYRSTSVRAAKLNIADVSLEHALKVLSLTPHTWVDRTAAEEYAAWLDYEGPEEDAPDIAGVDLRPIPGLIVDEMEAAGLPEFVMYDGDEGNGLAYERVAAYFIPILKSLWDTKEEQAATIQELTDLVNNLIAAPGSTLKTTKSKK